MVSAAFSGASLGGFSAGQQAVAEREQRRRLGAAQLGISLKGLENEQKRITLEEQSQKQQAEQFEKNFKLATMKMGRETADKIEAGITEIAGDIRERRDQGLPVPDSLLLMGKELSSRLATIPGMAKRAATANQSLRLAAQEPSTVSQRLEQKTTEAATLKRAEAEATKDIDIQKAREEAIARAEAKFGVQIANAQQISERLDSFSSLNERVNFSRAMGIPVGDSEVMLFGMSELSALNRAGEGNSDRARELNAVIQSVMPQNMFMQVMPDGSVQVGQGGANLFAQMTASQRQKQQSEVDRLTRVTQMLDETINQARSNPEQFGVVGSALRAGKKVTEVMRDLAVTAGFESLQDAYLSTANAIVEQIGSNKARAAFGDLFDPQLSENQIVENMLAIELMKTRINVGESGIRSLKSAFDDAKENVRLTGLTSTQDVIDRLGGVLRELRGVSSDLSRSLESTGTAPQGGTGLPALPQQSQPTGNVIRFDAQGNPLP